MLSSVDLLHCFPELMCLGMASRVDFADWSEVALDPPSSTRVSDHLFSIDWGFDWPTHHMQNIGQLHQLLGMFGRSSSSTADNFCGARRDR